MKKNLLSLVIACGLFTSAQAFADGAYDCGLAQGGVPATKAAVTNGSLTLVNGEYLGFVKEDADQKQLIVGIFFKADANTKEVPIAAGFTELGSRNLYLVVYHEGKEIQALCDKK